jgi:Leucine-rich repeat (LRR) protein
VLDLNEKFLSTHLGINVEELAKLEKIELRVDTSFHHLQITGEILNNLQSLKLNDSIIKSFRDLGTSFRNVQILYLSRCELKEIQGIQAFEQLKELYLGYNDIEELFDVGFLDNL